MSWPRAAAIVATAALLGAAIASTSAAVTSPPATPNFAPAPRAAQQLADFGAITSISPPPKVTAKGWLVYDAGADEAIAGSNISTPRPIASLSKLMTAIVAIERMDLDASVSIPAAVNDLPADAARMGARAGEKWPARDLLSAMLVYSANDAALALASEASDGDVAAFVKLMNAKAEQLGLDRTQFASPTGLDPAGALSTSTPIDLAALAEAALADPDIAATVAKSSISLTPPDSDEQPIKLRNRNPLIGSYPGVDGVKTGFTDAAGYMLITHHRDGVSGGELIIATLASSSDTTRRSDSRALLDWSRSLRRSLLIVEGGTELGSVPVQGSSRRLPVFACDDLRIIARVQQRLQQTATVPRSIAPPVDEGDEVGELSVFVTPKQADAPIPPTVPICAGASLSKLTRVEQLRERAKAYREAWREGIDTTERGWEQLRELTA